MCKFSTVKLLGSRTARKFAWEDTRPIVPSRKLSLVLQFQSILSFFRVWNVRILFGQVLSRKKGARKALFVGLRRHTIEYSASVMSLFSYFFFVPYLLPSNTTFMLNNVRYFMVNFDGIVRSRVLRTFNGQLMQSVSRSPSFVTVFSKGVTNIKSLRTMQVEASRSQGLYCVPFFSSFFIDIFRFVKTFNVFFLYRLIWTLFGLRWINARLRASYNDVVWGFLFTIALGVIFTGIQYFEYLHALYTIADSAYGTTFFLTTGFHGLHVIVGTLLLLVSYRRMVRYHYTLTHHVGMEAAIWYWHFVDVVWLGLYISVYHWGGQF